MNDFLQQITNAGVDALSRIEGISDSSYNQYSDLTLVQEYVFNPDAYSGTSPDISNEQLIFDGPHTYSLGQSMKLAHDAVVNCLNDDESNLEDVTIDLIDYASGTTITMTITEYGNMIQNKINDAYINCEILDHCRKAAPEYDKDSPNDNWINDLELPVASPSERSQIKSQVRQIARDAEDASAFINGILNFLGFNRASQSSSDLLWNELWTTTSKTTLAGIRGKTPGDMICTALDTASNLVERYSAGAISSITKQLFKPFGLQKLWWKVEKKIVDAAWGFLKYSGRQILDTGKWIANKVNKPFVNPVDYACKSKHMGYFDMGVAASIVDSYSGGSWTYGAQGYEHLCDDNIKKVSNALQDGATFSLFGVEYCMKAIADSSSGPFNFNIIRRVAPFDFKKFYELNKEISEVSYTDWTAKEFSILMNSSNECLNMDPTDEKTVINCMSYQLAFVRAYLYDVVTEMSALYQRIVNLDNEEAGLSVNHWNSYNLQIAVLLSQALAFGKDLYDGNIGDEQNHETTRYVGVGAYAHPWIEFSGTISNVDFSKTLTSYEVANFNGVTSVKTLRSMYNDFFSIPADMSRWMDDYYRVLEVTTDANTYANSNYCGREFYEALFLLYTNKKVVDNIHAYDGVSDNPLYGQQMFPYYNGFTRIKSTCSVNSDSANLNKAWNSWFKVVGATVAVAASIAVVLTLKRIFSWRVGLADEYGFNSFTRGQALAEGNYTLANQLYNRQKKIKLLLTLTGGTGIIAGYAPSMFEQDNLSLNDYQTSMKRATKQLEDDIDDLNDVCQDVYHSIV